jgi:hypothetical protein
VCGGSSSDNSGNSDAYWPFYDGLENSAYTPISETNLYNLGCVTLLSDATGANANKLGMSANTISEFKAVDFGVYSLFAEIHVDPSVDFNNRLVTLNQGGSKGRDADNIFSLLSS